MAKLFVISGEASGDLHGGNLVKELITADASLTIQGWGGERMQEEGAEILKHYSDLAFMGFQEVVANLRTILKNIKLCKQQITDFQPDAVVLIDYPGFNLRIAKWAKLQGFKVYYYITPQIWAWKKNRGHDIKKYVDQVYTILPFEKAFFSQFKVDAAYVGHPLLDEIERFKSSHNHQKRIATLQSESNHKKVLAILPGSRKQEIRRMLPIMINAANNFSDYECVIAGAPSLLESFYREIVGEKVKVVFNSTYVLLSVASLAMVTSGTATLETALFKVPQVVCYKGSGVSVQIARWLVNIKYISLVNLIMDKELVKELIQNDLTTTTLTENLKLLEEGTDQRQQLLAHYDQLISRLGGGGASALTAKLMLKTL